MELYVLALPMARHREIAVSSECAQPGWDGVGGVPAAALDAAADFDVADPRTSAPAPGVRTRQAHGARA